MLESSHKIKEIGRTVLKLWLIWDVTTLVIHLLVNIIKKRSYHSWINAFMCWTYFLCVLLWNVLLIWSRTILGWCQIVSKMSVAGGTIPINNAREFPHSIFPNTSLRCNYSIGCLHLCKDTEDKFFLDKLQCCQCVHDSLLFPC